MSEKNIRLTIEYDGSRYAGWQIQPRLRTIQGELQTALQKLTLKKVTIYCAGRTDAGVHALGQVANFRIAHSLPVEKYRDGTNFYLPDDIRIIRAEQVQLDFHARYDAVFRRYQYLIGLERSVVDKDRRWHIDRKLNLGRLNAVADYVLGIHDFAACCVVASQKENNRCLVYTSQWTRHDSVLRYDIAADRFLHNMIRSLVGLMVQVAQGDMTLNRFKEVFRSGDHTAVGMIAPACGLYLLAVGY